MKKTKSEPVFLRNGKADALLDYMELKKAASVLRAINHKLRQRMIDLLEQSVASQHLAILRRAGVVQTERNGKFIYYSLDKSRLGHISNIVEELAA
jgi:DNA-binding transcriptional ArsR family regulator